MITLPDPDLSPSPSRYYPTDFHKLTNRRASSPVTPDFAHPHRVAPVRATLPSADTTDRRACSRRDAPPCVVQKAPASLRPRQGSGSSIKEDAGGKITRRFVNIFTRSLAFLHCLCPHLYANSFAMRSGIAQSFLESINSSVPPIPHHEDKDVITPESGSCTCCCRCGRSDSWRASSSGRGHRRARSYTAPRTGISELTGLGWEPSKQAMVVEPPRTFAPGESPLEQLPVEVLGTSWRQPTTAVLPP